MSKNHTMDSNVTNASLSILSQQQHHQNQIQLMNLQQQQELQQKTKSFQSTRSLESAKNLARTSTQTHNNRQNSVHKDPRDPLTVQIPTSSNPTDVLAARFATWRSIIKLLSVYLKEVASVHEEVVRQQVRLQHLISFPFNMQGLNGELYQPFSQQPNNSLQEEVQQLSKFFLPLGNGSIQDLPSTLFQFHTVSSQMLSSIAKELNTTTIPRLEELRRDLLVKIKEIRGLQSDFKNSVGKEQQQTKQELQGFLNALSLCKKSSSSLQPRHDPYLLKLSLDKQIKKQLTEENYLHELFINLQGSGRELEKVVVIEIQALLTTLAKLLGQELQLSFDILITKLDSGFITKDAVFEWDSFISRDSNFVDPSLPMRHTTDIKYDGQHSALTTEVRSGYLERRSKFLKSYSKGYYVLTPTFIHEFKSPDRKKDPIPIMSLSLDDCQVAEHSKKEGDGSSWHKFVLHAKQNGIIHRGHNWVFRAESYDEMIFWYNDIKRLTSLPSPSARLLMLSQGQDEQRKASMKTKSISSLRNSTHAYAKRGDHLSLIDNTGVITVSSNQDPLPEDGHQIFTPTHPPPQDLTNTTLSSEVDFSTLSEHNHNLGSNKKSTGTVTEESLITPPDLYDNLSENQKKAFKKYSLDDEIEVQQHPVDRIFE